MYDWLNQLGDASKLREVALLHLAGHSNSEIAESLKCDVSTVERKLKLIHATWQQEDAE